MAKIKFDVTDQDPADSAGTAFEDPRPGVYLAKILEINPGFSKGDDGKADKNRPRLEVIYEILDEKYKGSRIWDYVSQTEKAKWKFDQWMLALGISSSKRKGEFDTDDYIGFVVKLRIKAEGGAYGTDDYRPKVGAIVAASDADQARGEEELEELGDGVHEDGDEIEADGEGYIEEALSEMSLKDLGAILTGEFDVERSDVPKGKDAKIEMILELQDSGDGDDGGDEEDETAADDEDGDDLEQLGEDADGEDEEAQERLTELAEENDLDPDEYSTWADLAEALAELDGGDDEEEDELDLDSMSVGDLRTKAEELGLTTTGTKAKLIEKIKAALNEEPF